MKKSLEKEGKCGFKARIRELEERCERDEAVIRRLYERIEKTQKFLTRACGGRPDSKNEAWIEDDFRRVLDELAEEAPFKQNFS